MTNSRLGNDIYRGDQPFDGSFAEVAFITNFMTQHETYQNLRLNIRNNFLRHSYVTKKQARRGNQLVSIEFSFFLDRFCDNPNPSYKGKKEETSARSCYLLA